MKKKLFPGNPGAVCPLCPSWTCLDHSSSGKHMLPSQQKRIVPEGSIMSLAASLGVRPSLDIFGPSLKSVSVLP
jgi:hypothetical protein